ncbi:PLP-dependent aminotransferase family protein [Rhodococcus sp. NPDC058505]|uniref:aminotransferase-like domain-containing protein n=1 Tax=Rhodococcus sp. NPDC058505 TaxID=3346531 RepID=UPI0036484198
MSSADRIVTDLRAWIASAAPGAQLPSSRELASRYGASPVTVQKAMRALIGLGLVESRPGAGSFVLGHRTPRALDFGWQTSALRSAAASVPSLAAPLREPAIDAIELHSGYPARELLPERIVRSALARASRGETAVTRSPAQGLPELQAWFASELASRTPAGVTAVAPRDVLVVPGTQSGLISVFRSVAGPGLPVLMESPTYWGAILAAAQAGVQIVPVAGDADGPDPDDVARAFAETGARLFYAQPTFANPTGARWSSTRRERVLAVVREHGAFLVEDDWACDFAIDGEAVPMAAYDDTGHIVYIRSLTKSVSPAVRVGAVIARGPVRERMVADRGAESMYVSGVLQSAALEVVLAPAWRTHLRSLRGQLRERRDLLARCVAEHLPQATLDRLPRGGLNLWVRLPDEVDAERLVRDCEQDGVLIAAGAEWFPADPSGPFVRLNFAGPDPSRFPDAARIIGRAVGTQLR